MTGRAASSSGVWVYWQGPCVVRGEALWAEAVVLPADTTNAAAADAVMRARFILRTLQKIARFRSGCSLKRGLAGEYPPASHIRLPAFGPRQAITFGCGTAPVDRSGRPPRVRRMLPEPGRAASQSTQRPPPNAAVHMR